MVHGVCTIVSEKRVVLYAHQVEKCVIFKIEIDKKLGQDFHAGRKSKYFSSDEH